MNRKILIVDDEPGIVNMLRSYFEIHSYQVCTAYNGSEALKQADAEMEALNRSECYVGR